MVHYTPSFHASTPKGHTFLVLIFRKPPLIQQRRVQPSHGLEGDLEAFVNSRNDQYVQCVRRRRANSVGSTEGGAKEGYTS